jgi:hypothetical protein
MEKIFEADAASTDPDKSADSSSRSRSTSAGSTVPSSATEEPAYLTIDDSTPGGVSAAAMSPQPQVAAPGLDEASPVYLSRCGMSEAWDPVALPGCEAPLAIKQVWASTVAEESPSFIVKDLSSTFNTISLEAQVGHSPQAGGDRLWDAIEDMLGKPACSTPGEAGSRKLPFGINPLAAMTEPLVPAQAPSPALVLRLADALPGSVGTPGSAKDADAVAGSPGNQVLRIAEALPELEIASAEVPTRGSAGHRFGVCKPCAFFHTKGCGNGFDCPFCHLCMPDEIRRRKKAKRASKHTICLDEALDVGAEPSQ